MKWDLRETPEGNVFTSEMVDGYLITQYQGRFYVRRNVDDAVLCDDIGPLEGFEEAENILIRIQIALADFEEQLWRVSAALHIKNNPGMLDGTASLIDDVDDFAVPDTGEPA